MRSGVSVEQLKAFNADLGNPLVDEKLQVGKPIYVPMGEGWQYGSAQERSRRRGHAGSSEARGGARVHHDAAAPDYRGPISD